MLISSANLSTLHTGFKAAFQAGFGGAASQYARIATVVPSAAAEEEYGWLGDLPGVREWIGDRVIHGIRSSGYVLRNKDYEQTIGVPRNAIEDDRFGIYAPLFTELGRSAASFPDTLVFGLLKAAEATPCFDGQYFFDTDHPVAGGSASASNWGGGAGALWVLMDVSRALKPLILQKRKDFAFVARTRAEDDNVFMRKEFVWGTDGRFNAGFGFWQMAYGSRQTLDATAYATARAAMGGLKNDAGQPLGLVPNLLVVPPALEAAGRTLLTAETAANGASNPWKGTAELLVCPWLAE